MADAAPSGTERNAGAPDALAAPLTLAELERLAELVYRLLRDDVIRAQERRSERSARWR